jgi:hypothetical protein
MCCKRAFDERTDQIKQYKQLFTDVLDSYRHKDSFGTFLPRLREKLWIILEKPNSSIYARIYFIISLLFIPIVLLESVLRTTIPSDHFNNNNNATNTTNSVQNNLILYYFNLFEIIALIWYSWNFFIRIFACPNRIKFLKLNLLDLVYIVVFLVYYLNYYILVDKSLLIESLKNIVKLTKFGFIFKYANYLKYHESFRLLVYTIKNSSRDLWALTLYLAFVVIIFSSIVYQFEKYDNVHFSSIPNTFWWTFITVTTVGYGIKVYDYF